MWRTWVTHPLLCVWVLGAPDINILESAHFRIIHQQSEALLFFISHAIWTYNRRPLSPAWCSHCSLSGNSWIYGNINFLNGFVFWFTCRLDLFTKQWLSIIYSYLTVRNYKTINLSITLWSNKVNAESSHTKLCKQIFLS